MHKPTRVTAAPVFMQTFAIQPDTATGLILNLEIVAQGVCRDDLSTIQVRSVPALYNGSRDGFACAR